MTIVLSEDRVNLNTPATKSGPPPLAELHAARCPPCHGMCHQGRQCNADACAPEGGRHHDPAPSGSARRDVIGARIGLALLLSSAVTVIGVVAFAVLARWPMAWPLG